MVYVDVSKTWMEGTYHIPFALVTNTLTNVVQTIFDHLRNGKKIVRTAFARVFVTTALQKPLFLCYHLTKLDGVFTKMQIVIVL